MKRHPKRVSRTDFLPSEPDLQAVDVGAWGHGVGSVSGGVHVHLSVWFAMTWIVVFSAQKIVTQT
jgi:hypothetical protein